MACPKSFSECAAPVGFSRSCLDRAHWVREQHSVLWSLEDRLWPRPTVPKKVCSPRKGAKNGKGRPSRRSEGLCSRDGEVDSCANCTHSCSFLLHSANDTQDTMPTLHHTHSKPFLLLLMNRWITAMTINNN